MPADTHVIEGQPRPLRRAPGHAPLVAPRRRPFYLLMSLAVAVVVVVGFSYTIDGNLIHPAQPRPALLGVHAALFSIWVVAFIAQTALVYAGRTALHRRLGRVVGALGVAMVPVGIGTAISMARFHLAHGSPDAAVGFPIPLWDMTAFSVFLTLGLVYRRSPEVHRRLMLVATCVLTAAGFGRLPILDHAEWFYAGVDALVLVAAVHDWLTTRSVHPVYRYALPALVAGQCLTSFIRWTPAWLAAAPGLFR